MALSYDIDPVDKVVFIRIYDIIAMRDICQMMDKIRADSHFAHKMSVLIDARELKRAFFMRETDSLIRLFSSSACAFIDSYAFVVASDLVSNVGRRFLVKARRAGLDLSVYGDHLSALKRLRD